MPKTRIGFWREKLEGNKKRDAEIERELKKDGWSVLVIWECQTKPSHLESLASRIISFLGSPASFVPEALDDRAKE